MPARKDLHDSAIRIALEAAGGMVAGAAHLLGVSPMTLHRRLKRNPRLRRSQSELDEFEINMALYKAAIGGDVRAIIFWERHFVGWGRAELPCLRTRDEYNELEDERRRNLP